MKKITLNIHSVDKGDLPTIHKAKVFCFTRGYPPGTIIPFSVQMFWWNDKRKCFMWHNITEHHVAFWFYETELLAFALETNGK